MTNNSRYQAEVKFENVDYKVGINEGQAGFETIIKLHQLELYKRHGGDMDSTLVPPNVNEAVRDLSFVKFVSDENDTDLKYEEYKDKKGKELKTTEYKVVKVTAGCGVKINKMDLVLQLIKYVCIAVEEPINSKNYLIKLEEKEAVDDLEKIVPQLVEKIKQEHDKAVTMEEVNAMLDKHMKQQEKEFLEQSSYKVPEEKPYKSKTIIKLVDEHDDEKSRRQKEEAFSNLKHKL